MKTHIGQSLKEKIELYQKYLQQLEEKRAYYGTAHCPTYILVEIEFIKRRLQTLIAPAEEDFNAFHNLPKIFGRAMDVDRIKTTLFKENIVIIEGKPGVGKTSLALLAAHQLLQDKKFERIIFLSSKDTKISLIFILDEIARVTNRLDVLQLEFAEKVRRILTILRHIPCLIVLDNCETIPDKEIYTFLGKISSPSKSLLTSRMKHASLSQQATSIVLSGLDINAVREMLNHELVRLGMTSESNQDIPFLHELFEITQGVPLVIKLALGRSQEIGTSLKYVIDELRDGKSDIQILIFEKLTSNLDRNSKTLLVLMSLLSDGTDRETLKKICKFTEEDFGKAIQPLIMRYLIDIPINTVMAKQSYYSIHPLIRSYTINSLVSQNSLIRIRNLAILYFKSLVAEQCSHIYMFDYNVLENNLKNIFIIMDYCHDKQRWEDYLAFYKLYYFLGESGFWSHRSKIAEKMILIAKNVERQDVLALTLADNRGWLLIQQDLLEEAEKANREALEIYTEMEDTYGLANTLRNLGLIKRDIGDINVAKNFFERSLNIALAHNHYKVTADIYISLGSTAKDGNDLMQAKTFYNKALSYYKLANYDTGVGWALGNLGHVARLREEYDEAKELYGEALDRLSRVNRLDRIAVVREGLALMEKECSNITAAYVNACTAEELYTQLGMDAKAQKVIKLQREIKKLSEAQAGED
jgi:tetratricopeptide (TPR) repeat protein